MRRETKVGLAVTSTFVCLVGVVVASKLHRPAAALELPVEESQEPPGTPPPASSGPVAQAAPNKQIDPPPPGLPPLNISGPSGPTDLPNRLPNSKGSEGKSDSPLEIPPLPQQKAPQITSPPPAGRGAPLPPPIQIEEKPPSRKVAGAPPSVADPTSPVAGGVKLDGPPKIDLPAPIVKAPEPTEPVSPQEKTGAAPKTSDQIKLGDPPLLVPPAPPAASKTDSLPPAKVEPPAPPPPTPVASTPETPSVVPKAALPLVKDVGTAPASSLGPPSKIGFGNDAMTTSAVSVPLKGGPALGAVALPPVTVRSDEEYVCKADDANFDRLGERLYGSPQYGKALLEYNRNHILMAQDSSIRRDPPLLSQGQKIRLPSKALLDAEYGRNVPATGAATAAPPVGLKAPVPLMDAAKGQAPAAGLKTFHVPPSGMWVYQLAKQTLGAGLRWTEIHNLNRSIVPERLIPGGTVVYLPADAKVD
jgi:hypothetical protein